MADLTTSANVDSLMSAADYAAMRTLLSLDLLVLESAAVLAQRNSTNAQTHKIYNTYTDASNGEWLSLDWATANVATIKPTANGTGTVRALRLESLGARLLHQTGDSSNTFLGNSSGNYAVSGSNNTGAGYNTLASVTSGVLNSAFGGGALDVETTGSYNTAVGVGSLGGQNGATYNTAMGRGAGILLSTGSNNTILGGLAGGNLTTGASNIIIGYNIDAQSATTSGQISIGNLIFGTAVGTGTTASTGNVGIGVVAPVNKLSVDGTIKSKTYTVATLPAAATVGAGATAFVSDGSVVHAGNSGTVVAGSGANFVPVYSDATNWRIT